MLLNHLEMDRVHLVGTAAGGGVALDFALSALAALSEGLLGGIGILIDLVVFVPLVWFAVWYQRHRRVE